MTMQIMFYIGPSFSDASLIELPSDVVFSPY